MIAMTGPAATMMMSPASTMIMARATMMTTGSVVIMMILRNGEIYFQVFELLAFEL